ncbi:MAG: hypothetical protein AXW14_15445 [Alteromonas sp. Nap_26]|nr:MAG: hypothetical protein AXW14_15445 [Alteromonas sp. Nap_26]
MSNQHSPNRYWKVEVQGQIQKFILDAFHASRQKVVDRISLVHKEKTNSVNGFRFRGEPYVHSLNNLQPYQLRRLHASLVEEFQAHFDEWERHSYRQHEVNGYINQTLNKANNSTDLHLLFPSCVHSVLPEKLDSVEPSLNPEEISQYLEESAEGVRLLKMQLILNTLKA